MIAGSVALLFVVLGQGTPQEDVIVLKHGSPLRGLIVEETDEAVVLRITTKGAKGETLVAANQTIPRDEIVEIRRMDAEAREKAKSEGSGVHAEWAREDRLAKIDVVPARFDGYGGLRATGELFEVLTTSDEGFARDACDALQEVYEGYLQHFKLRRGGVRRLPVIILTGRAQYDEYLTRRYGAPVPGSVGLYIPRDNVIITYNCVQRDEAARIRGSVIEEKKKIESLRKEIRAHEEKIDEEAKAARQKVLAEAAQAKADIRRADPANRPALLRKVDEIVASENRRISEWKAARLKNLGGFRKTADADIAECRRVISHNELVLKDQNREMFETLFHECFHAFAKNRLYVDKEIPRWLDEGMACYFEMSVMENGNLLHGAPNRDRMKLYRAAAAKRKLPDLESVLRGADFVVEHEGHIDRAVSAYAVSWALAHYLCTRMTREEMDAYVGSVAAGADPARALVKALNQPLAKIDEAVRAHVAALK